MENKWLTYLDEILSKYNIKYQKVNNVIDSSNNNDFRLNIILDNKYIVRINNSNVITEERLNEIDRLITRYNDIGVYVPHYIKNSSGLYSIMLEDKICYVSEYADYQLASELDLDQEKINKEMLVHLGILANKYTNYDLSKIKSMWSIIDLAPLDVDIDEKQENLNWLVDELKNIDECELANKVIEFNKSNREEILKVFNYLPRCMYQGDLNNSNILIKDDHFYGLIDFNLSGTEVNINCFLAETNRGLDEEDLNKYSAKDILDEMIKYQNKCLEIIFKNYELIDIEKQVFENYRNIIFISQYPNVCYYVDALNKNNKNKMLELIRLIVDR